MFGFPGEMAAEEMQLLSGISNGNEVICIIVGG